MGKAQSSSVLTTTALAVLAGVGLSSCGEQYEASPDADVASLGSGSQGLTAADSGHGPLADVRLTFTLRTRHGVWGGALVRLVDNTNYYRFRCKAGSGRALLERVEAGAVSVLAKAASSPCKVAADHTVVIEAEGSLLSVSVDGTLLLEADDSLFGAGGVALYGEGGRRQPCRSSGVAKGAANGRGKGAGNGSANGRDASCPEPGPQSDNLVSLELDNVQVEILPGDELLLSEDFNDGGYPNWVAVDSNPAMPSRWSVIEGRITYQSSVGNAGGSQLRFVAGNCGDGTLDPGEVCERGVGCNQRCQPGSACAGVDCSGLDSACLVGQCDEVSWLCSAVAGNEGGSCNDGAACTSGDSCTSGVCAGTAYTCDDGNICTTDACTGDGTCSTSAVADGSSCDDGVSCTQADTCTAGACSGSAYVCDDGESCTTDRCNGDGTCGSTAVLDGTTCDDADACTAGDACLSGQCTGSVSTQCSEPGPSIPAPPLDPTASTSLGDSTAFLYSGPDPIQTGVEPGTIESGHAAVIRGRVIDRTGAPLAFATVTILGHPEFGQTVSRGDGMYDLAVNGGGFLTVDIAHAGYLPSQRTVKTAWESWSTLEDVALVALDPLVTSVDLSGSTTTLQFAAGSVSTDADGTRQARVLFPAATKATMTLADGTTLPVSTLSVRATEYTVGDNGPKSMPGALPPTSGYTYAVELSADEAIARGAIRVDFSQPVLTYVDNFLGFSVGGIVPSGYYDRAQAAWIAAPNGRVIGILGVSAGLAELDIDGSGAAAGLAELSALGVTDAERAQLALAYSAGESVWRVPVTHFTPWDFNMPSGPPPDAEYSPSGGGGGGPPTCEDLVKGSVVGVQGQTLGEVVAISGTPHRLHYSSLRARGYSRGIVIPLTGDAPSASLKRVEVTVEIAGRREVFSYLPSPNLDMEYVWDGLDAYGREHTGATPATFTTTSVYNIVYLMPADLDQSFGAPSDTSQSWGFARATPEVKLERVQRHNAYSPFTRGDTGNWTFNHHHRLDPGVRIVHLGDGSEMNVEDRMISAFAGTGVSGYTGDGGRAVEATLGRDSIHMAFAPNGELYFTDPANCVVRKIDQAGIITTVAGTNCETADRQLTDGGPAADAVFARRGMSGIAVDSVGNILVIDATVVRKISTDGTISLFAGQYGVLGRYDGLALATATSGPYDVARLGAPIDLSVDDAGNVYIVDNGGWVRRVGLDNHVVTVIGGGYERGVGIPGTGAWLIAPQTAEVDPAGRLHVADYGCTVRRMGADGIMELVAGDVLGGCTDEANGPMASTDRIGWVQGLAFGDQDEVYMVDSSCVRVVLPGGRVHRVAGMCGVYGDTAEMMGVPGPALEAPMEWLTDVAIGPDGSLYVATNAIIYKISRPLSGVGTSVYTVPSADGSLVYRFDPAGRHIDTRSATTGTPLLSFFYDGEGLLSEIVDLEGGVTTIERDAEGTATAIVSPAPYNLTTHLVVDEDAHLTSITDPAGADVSATYSADGLLETFKDALGNTSTMAYDSMGRLLSDADASGGGWDFVAPGAAGASGYFSGATVSGDGVRISRDPNGLETWSTKRTDGSVSMRLSNGMDISGSGRPSAAGKPNGDTDSLTVRYPSGMAVTASYGASATFADEADQSSLQTRSATQTIAGRTITTTYDAATRTGTDVSPSGRVVTTVFNAKGRAMSVQSPGLPTKSVVRDAHGRITSVSHGTAALKRTSTLSYGASGFLDSYTTPMGQLTTYQVDAVGRPTSATLPSGQTTSIAYDGKGQVSSVTTPAGETHGWVHSSLGQVTRYTPPAVGAAVGHTAYAYDVVGRIREIQRPDGQVVNFTYDGGGRPLTTTSARGTWTYAYSPTTNNPSVSTNPEGDTLSFGFDGNLPTSENWAGRVTGSVSRAYDSGLRIASQTVSSHSISFSYDDDARLTQAGALTVTRDLESGFETSTALGAVTTGRTHSVFGEVQTDRADFGILGLYSTSYLRDAAGRITQKTESVLGTESVYDYSYDRVDRLIAVERDGVQVSTYLYDDNDNRLSRSSSAGDQVGIYDAQDRAISYAGASYSYTGNGELAARTRGNELTQYSYDSAGNLLAVLLPDGRNVTYAVDAAGRRVAKYVNGSQTGAWLYSGRQRIVAELAANGDLVSRFVYGARSNVPDYMVRNGATYRFVVTEIGSPRLIVDVSTGAVVQRIDYDEFGAVLLDTNPGFQPFGFAGGHFDTDTGLVRFGARDYDSELGRFTAKDPSRFAGGGTNFYIYASNDPINYADVNGLNVSTMLEWASNRQHRIDFRRTADLAGDVNRFLGDKGREQGLSTVADFSEGARMVAEHAEMAIFFQRDALGNVMVGTAVMAYQPIKVAAWGTILTVSGATQFATDLLANLADGATWSKTAIDAVNDIVGTVGNAANVFPMSKAAWAAWVKSRWAEAAGDGLKRWIIAADILWMLYECRDLLPNLVDVFENPEFYEEGVSPEDREFRRWLHRQDKAFEDAKDQ